MTFLDRIHTVTAVLDACEMGADRCTAAIHGFFAGKDVKVYALALDKGMRYLTELSDAEIVTDVKRLGGMLSRSEDLYVNLCCGGPKALTAAERKNLSSRAEIRAARTDSSARPYDIVLSGTEDAVQRRVFVYLSTLLEQIR